MSDQQTVQPPPRPPGSSGSPSGPNDESLVRRIERLEDAQMDTRERLVRLETRVDAIAEQMATKADLAALEASMLKWYIGTSAALASLAFAAARFIK